MFTAADQWTFLIMNYVIHSAILIALISVLIRVRPFVKLKTREHLWKFALVGGIITAVFQSFSDLNLFEITPDFGVETGIVKPEPETSHWFEANDLSAPDFSASSPIEIEEPLPALNNWQIDWSIIILGLSAFLIGRLLLRRKVFLKSLQMSKLENEAANEILNDLVQRAGFQPSVQLLSTKRLQSPVALSKNRICIPEELLEGLNASQIRSLLAHELAHLQRKDPQWLLLINLVTNLFYFQPLNQVVRSKLRFIMENAADRQAVKLTGDRALFTETLLTVARWNKGGKLPVHALAFANNSSLKQRVSSILKEDKSQTQVNRWHISFIAILLLSLVAFVSPELSEQKSTSVSAIHKVTSNTADQPVITSATVAEKISLPPHLQANTAVKNASLWSKPTNTADLTAKEMTHYSGMQVDTSLISDSDIVEENSQSSAEERQARTGPGSDQDPGAQTVKPEDQEMSISTMARLRHVNYEKFKKDFWPMLVASGLLKKRNNTVELTYGKLHVNGKLASEASIQPFRRLIETHFPKWHWEGFQYKRERFKVDDIKRSMASIYSNSSRLVSPQMSWKEKQKQDSWRQYRAELALNLLNDGVIKSMSENISIKWRKTKVFINGKKFTEEDFFKYRSIKNKYFPVRAV